MAVKKALDGIKRFWQRYGVVTVVVLILAAIVIAIVISEMEQQKKKREKLPEKAHKK